MSHPARGAWIETLVGAMVFLRLLRRTPPGVRGLKQKAVIVIPLRVRSHPARGAWIETAVTQLFDTIRGSHPARGAWIETLHPITSKPANLCRTPPGVRGLKRPHLSRVVGLTGSHPARGAWIETAIFAKYYI